LHSRDIELLRVLKTVYSQSVLSSKDLKEFNSQNTHIYSIHSPEVECISKGKLNKKYEFGNKVSIASCLAKNFILSAKTFHNNPYDGHTLFATVSDIQNNTRVLIEKVFVDRGYRGNDYPSKGKIFSPYTTKKLEDQDKKDMKRRSAIEASISHLKRYYRLGRNYLKGKIGDIINPILASIGYNFAKILRHLIG
jgi:IS5 family transposase